MVIGVLAGAILGFLSGLGIGGGSFLIIWLTAVMGIPGEKAQSINLLFFLTAAGSVTWFRWRKGAVNFREILPAVIAGCLSAGVCTWLGSVLHPQLLKRAFGMLLLITGVRELFYRPRKAR